MKPREERSATWILGSDVDGAFAQKWRWYILAFLNAESLPYSHWEDQENQIFGQLEDGEEEPIIKLDWDTLFGGQWIFDFAIKLSICLLLAPSKFAYTTKILALAPKRLYGMLQKIPFV